MDEQRALQACEVLQLVVQHCDPHDRALNTPQQLCTLLQVSSRVNTALRQCRGRCSINVNLSPGPYRSYSDDWIAKPWAFVRFAAWLPKHAGLVNSITVREADGLRARYQGFDEQDESDRVPDCKSLMDEPCAQLLETALQQSTAAAAAAAGQSQPLLLQLDQFSSAYCLGREGLTALAAAKVEIATIRHKAPTAATAAYCAAFAQLTDLQELTLTSGRETCVPGRLVAVLGQLPQLTSLQCDRLLTSSASCLPDRLRTLNAGWLPTRQQDDSSDDDDDDAEVVSLRHMTALEDLTWQSGRSGILTAVLPRQLTSLGTGGPLKLCGEAGLKKLIVDGRLTDSDDLLGVMRHLQPMSNLQFLCVDIPNFVSARLPQSDLRAAVTAISSLRALTELQFLIGSYSGGPYGGMDGDDDGPGLSEVPLCASLRSLPNLQRLELSSGWKDGHSNPQDLLNLTVLTQLTDLDVSTPGVTDTIAVALLSSLTPLQRLRLVSNSIHTASFLPVLAGLTDLRSLELWDQRCGAGGGGDGRVTPFNWQQHEVMLLSRLTKLQHLRALPASAWDSVSELRTLLPLLR